MPTDDQSQVHDFFSHLHASVEIFVGSSFQGPSGVGSRGAAGLISVAPIAAAELVPGVGIAGGTWTWHDMA